MRSLLLALPFALLPLVSAHAASEAPQHEEHASLAAHEHGSAQLNVALDGKRLELALESPTMNIVGFEHAAVSDSDRAAANAAQKLSLDPLMLFSLPAAANCVVASHSVESPLFTKADTKPAAADEHQHSDVDASYALDCNNPEQLQGIDLAELFKRFPATQKIQVQLIGPKGQQGAELSPANPRLSF
jgi:hypothetical protein